MFENEKANPKPKKQGAEKEKEVNEEQAAALHEDQSEHPGHAAGGADLTNVEPLNVGNSYDKMFDEHDSKFAKDLKEVTGKYLSLSKDFTEGQTKSFIFYGMSQIVDNRTGEAVTAAMLRNKEGESFITANTVIVGSCSKLENPAYIRIKYTGKKKGSSGNFYDAAEVVTA